MKKTKTAKQARTTSKKSTRKIGDDELKQVAGGLRRKLGDARFNKVTSGELSRTSWDVTSIKAT